MCGIFACINREEDLFDYKTFCALGIANDRRGGDSCGIFIDGEVEYGIKDTAKFENFFWTSKLLQETQSCVVALGHDRKASVGGITLEKAHPIVIKNDKGDTDFVLVHNGTIHNYEDLAKKYIPNKKITDLSDSQVLALILYNTGFDVLSEYIGGTAFICTDYRSGNPVTYFYRGKSKDYPSSKDESDERPLYFYKDDKRLILSSIASYLSVLTSDSDEEVYEPTANTVFMYRNGVLYKYKTIDRSKCSQHSAKSYSGYYGGIYDSYDASFGQYSNYIGLNPIERRYSIENKPITGKYCISNYGRVLVGDEKKRFDNHTVYFFEGYAMKSKKHYQLAQLLCKKSGLKQDEFIKTYASTFIYLTLDQLYRASGVTYIVSKPGKMEPFSGSAQMLTSSTIQNYLNGSNCGTSNNSSCKDSFDKYESIDSTKLDYKSLYKQCLESMK